jgi:hypothetical protein
MSTRLLVKAALCLAIVLLTANAVRLAIPKVWAQSVAVVPNGGTAVPYTVVLTETVTNAAGQRRAAPTQTFAVRSDGATVLKLGDGESRHIRFTSGIQVEVSDVLRVKSTTYRVIRESWLLDPSENCTKSLTGTVPAIAKGTTTIEEVAGHRTVKIVSGSTTRWFALDHACALIRRTNNYMSQGSSQLELVSLTPGEPDDALFQIPADYQEGAPSAFVAAPSADCDAACRESQKRHLERLDKSYYSNRPQ